MGSPRPDGPPTCAGCSHTRSDHRRGHTYPEPDSPAKCLLCDCQRTWAQIDADQERQPHEFTVEHSGRFVRIVCTCSWAGDWNPDHIPTLSKRLHSDENAHRAAVRRTEA